MSPYEGGSTVSIDFDFLRMMIAVENIRTYWSFICLKYPFQRKPNVLSIIMRAVNRIKCHCHIHQPRWSALRWKSKT
jgi:hypothetical protein